MAGPGNILIKIGAEAGQAIGELEKVNSAMGKSATKSEKVGAALKRAAVPATIALTAIAVGAKKAIDSAAELEKQVQKTAKVFGPSGDAIVKWSEHLAESFGLSSAEALTMADKFGQLFENLGFGRKAAVGMSEQMVQLAADLASFNNVPVDQTMAALQSGLSGATRGLKKYGIVIDSTMLKQKAATMGLYSGKGALDAHAKAAATMSLILEQTSKAQGDFARNSHDAANESKIQAAETANLKEELGKGLLPYYESGQKLLIALTKALAGHTTAVKVAVGVIAALSAGVLVANAAFKAWTVATNVAKLATIAFSAANRAMMVSLMTNPIGLAIVAIVALGAALVIAYKKSATFRAIVNAGLSAVANAAHSVAAAFGTLEAKASAAWSWVKSHWTLAAFALGPLVGGLVLLATHFDKVKAAGMAAFNAIAGPIHSVTSAIEAAINAVKSLIGWLGKIKVPSIKLPHVPGLNLASYVPAAPAAGPYAAAAVGGVGGGVTVNFYGPTDPEGAARAIARVLRSHETRQGRASMRGG